MTAVEILREMNAERFHDVLSASPKIFREELFRRAGIKVKRKVTTLKSRNKNKLRAEKLLASLRDGNEIDGEVLDEVIRNYLYTRRTILIDAMEHFDVPHDEGLTDEDLTFIDELSEDKSTEVRELLAAKHGDEDVVLYLRFMKFPGI